MHGRAQTATVRRASRDHPPWFAMMSAIPSSVRIQDGSEAVVAPPISGTAVGQYCRYTVLDGIQERTLRAGGVEQCAGGQARFGDCVAKSLASVSE